MSTIHRQSEPQQKASDRESSDREKSRGLQKRVTELTGQVALLDKRVALLKQENTTLKKKNEDHRPAEEKIKNLKKRNAELAAIARKLEEKAKQLQNENSKRRSVSSQSPQDPEQLRKTFAKQRAKELTEHAKSIMMRDHTIEVLRQRCQELSDKCASNDVNMQTSALFHDQSELEDLVKQAARDRLRLEKQATKYQNEEKNHDAINQKAIECEALYNKLEEVNLRSQSLEAELKDVITKNTDLTVQNIELKTKLQAADKLSEEVTTLRSSFAQSQTECLGAQTENNQLKEQLQSLQQQLLPMKDIEEHRKQLEKDKQDTLESLHKREHELSQLLREKEDMEQADTETITDLQIKLGDLEKKYELQAIKHHALTAEIEQLRKETEQTKMRHPSDIQTDTQSGGRHSHPTPSDITIATDTGEAGDNRRKEDMGAKLNNRLSQLDNDISVGLSTSKKLPFLVYVAKYAYDPVQNSPNENPEAELQLNVGDYIFVYGDPDEDGFFEGELMDGRHGLVPSNFVDKVPDEELEDFHTVLGLANQEAQIFNTSNTQEDFQFNSSDESAEHKTGLDMSGVPEPPVNVQADRGPLEGSVMVTWLPVTITKAGTSNMAAVRGYNVYMDGMLVKSLQNPTGDHIILDKGDLALRSSDHCVLTIRTQAVSRQESQDSSPVHLTPFLVTDAKVIPTTTTTTASIEPAPKIVEMAGNLPASSSELSDITELDEEEDMPKAMGRHKHSLHLSDPKTKPAISSAISPTYDHYSPSTSPPQAISPTIHTHPDRLVEGGPGHDLQDSKVTPRHAAYRNQSDTATWVQNRSPLTPNYHQPGPGYHHMTVPHIEITKDSSGSLSGSGPDNYSDDEDINGVNGHVAPTPLSASSGVRGQTRQAYRPDGQPEPDSGHGVVYRGHGAKHSDPSLADRTSTDRHVAKMNELNQEQSLRGTSKGRDGSGGYRKNSDTQKDSSYKPHSKRRDYFDGETQPHTTQYEDTSSSYSQLEDNNYITSRKIRDDIPLSDLIDYEDDGGDSLIDSVDMEYDMTSGGLRQQPVRVFIALFDYDPATMSPNPDAIDEELSFKEGQLIKIYGDKDPDGFFMGEAAGHQGFVPCNMVSEVAVDDPEVKAQLLSESGGHGTRSASASRGTTPRTANNSRGMPNSRPTSNKSNQHSRPVSNDVSRRESRPGSSRSHSPLDTTRRRMVALYDYDPHALSPNVDSELELSFKAGDYITVYGDMDEDGFYSGERNGICGLVPSNFLEDISGSIPDLQHRDLYKSQSGSNLSHRSDPTHSSHDSKLDRLDRRDERKDSRGRDERGRGGRDQDRYDRHHDRSWDRDHMRDRVHERERDHPPRDRDHGQERDHARDRDHDKDRQYNRSRDRSRDRNRNVNHDINRDRSRERSRNINPEISRERSRDRSRDTNHDRSRDVSRERSRKGHDPVDGGRLQERGDRPRDRSRDRDRKPHDRSKSPKERPADSRSRDRSRERGVDRSRSQGKGDKSAVIDNGAVRSDSQPGGGDAADKSGFAPPRPRPPPAMRQSNPSKSAASSPSANQTAVIQPTRATPPKEKASPAPAPSPAVVEESPPPSPMNVINMDINVDKKEKKGGILARGKSMFKKLGK